MIIIRIFRIFTIKEDMSSLRNCFLSSTFILLLLVITSYLLLACWTNNNSSLTLHSGFICDIYSYWTEKIGIKPTTNDAAYLKARSNAANRDRQQHAISSVAYFDHVYKSTGELLASTTSDREVSFTIPIMSKPVKDDESTRVEALSTMHLAIEFRKNGKYEKAKRLFTHALALQPHHPDILTQYGLYFEIDQDDLLRADHLYTRALLASPNHSLARTFHNRTQPLVAEIDQQMLRLLDQKRQYFISIGQENGALKRAKRDAYFEHIYHTVAIEGNTMNLIQTRSLLETQVAIGGKSIMEHNEILGLDAALRFLDQVLVQRLGSIRLDDIREIHRRVFGFVDPIDAGQFRTTQVWVGSFTPIHPLEIEREMFEFLDWLNSDTTLGIHPVELSALAHYKFVVIHPFIDGNGRTARLLMNLILMQAGFPPVIIRVEDRLEYYETLKAANEGDLRPFIRFVARNTDRTLDEYFERTNSVFDGNNRDRTGKRQIESTRYFAKIVVGDGRDEL